MEYISAEEFLKQDKEVQSVLIDYFEYDEMLYKDGIIYYGEFKPIKDAIPLLTEGQLRKFIEDKIGSKVNIICKNATFTVYTNSDLYGEYERRYFYDGGGNVLDALWDMAVETAKIITEGEKND